MGSYIPARKGRLAAAGRGLLVVVLALSGLILLGTLVSMML